MRGYFDESGTHDQSRVTTIAGWVATTEMWRKCLVEWQAALDKKGLLRFHGSEFDYFTRQNKWSAEEYSAFIEELTGILPKRTGFGVSGSVVTSAYEKLPEWVREKIRSRYHFCFHVVMHKLMKKMKNIISNDALVLTFEQKDDEMGRILESFKKDYIAHDYHNQLDGFFFGSKEKFPLLQTADFLVYEMNKWIDNALYSDKPVRPQIEMLAKGRKKLHSIYYGYHDEETLAGFPAILEQDREEVVAGMPSDLIWWPASWHRNYTPK